MDRRTLHVPTTAQRVSPISPTRTLLDRPHTACSAGTGSEQSGSPHSSLTSSGRDSTTAVKAVLAPQVFGRWKDAALSTPLDQSLVKSEEDWWRVPNTDEERESYSGVRSYNSNIKISVTTERETSSWQASHAENDDEAPLSILREAPVDLLDSNEEECSPRIVVFRVKGGVVRQRQKRSKEFSNGNRSTCSKAAKIAVDLAPLSATSAFLSIPSSDVSPVDLQTSFCHTDSELQDTEVSSTDNNEESNFNSSKIDVLLLMRFNRHNRSNVLYGLVRWRLGEVGNRMIKFQAAARAYLLRTKPLRREPIPKEPISPSPFSGLLKRRGPEADNDRVLQLERRMDQEIKSREAMKDCFEEVVDEMRASKSAEERRLREELEQTIVQDHPSGGMSARSSQENSIHPSSNKRAPIKVSVTGPPPSRSPLPDPSDRLVAKSNAHKVVSDQTKVTTAGSPSSILVSGRASLREDQRTIFAPEKATTNVRSGKSVAVRKEPKPLNNK
ncbi:hypothetical protein BC936DRAFT_147840 [Jimgerdemannia flammicorona]|uniref:Uncharacterized protein n=1 Tax=Jimgerdemannia flammicorona TaxID=994334 RepID=A0A433D4J4_9FUNG|nr:hypothetical protein BC936DRAFT_147840 [Jimgerdemannia flammicorona]